MSPPNENNKRVASTSSGGASKRQKAIHSPYPRPASRPPPSHSPDDSTPHLLPPRTPHVPALPIPDFAAMANPSDLTLPLQLPNLHAPPPAQQLDSSYPRPPPIQSRLFPGTASPHTPNTPGQTVCPPAPATISRPVHPSTTFNINNYIAGDQFNSHSNAQDNPHEKICRWLGASDPSSNHKSARSKRQPKTGNWFIQGDVFALWMTGTCQNLWLHGRPGCGKTILSSTIIEAIIGHCNVKPASSMAYFYFDFQSREKQTCQNLLRSLITQLCLRLTTIPESLAQLYSRSESSRYEPDIDDLAMALKGMLQELSDAFIIVDALDECIERKLLLKLVEDMIGWRLNNVHLLFTSRKEREIEDCLGSRVSHQVDIQEEVIAQDIELHVQESLRNDTRLKKWPTKVHEEIKFELTKRADGMFRWVACQLDDLQKCAKLSELRKTLRCLPRTLDDTYERILTNIDDLYKEDVHRVLQWLCFSLRPITLDQMVEALAVTLDDRPKIDPDERYADPRDIPTRCSSLVSISAPGNGYNELRLAHFSVKEYLTSDRISNGKARIYGVMGNCADELISQTCVAYLLQFNTPDCLNESTIGQYPLAGYAARFWVKHARFEEDGESDKLLGLIMELFQSPQAKQHTWPFVNWVRLWDIGDLPPGRDFHRTPDSIPYPFYYAALGGMLSIVQRMIEEGVDVDVSDGRYDIALCAASFRGHERIVELLLQRGVNVNADGGMYGSALQAASADGDERIVELLLQHGANVNADGGIDISALQLASLRGHERIVELLLQHGAEVNADGGTSALYRASFGGHKLIVELLLQHGANVNADGGMYGTALQLASLGGREHIVELLLQYGANVNADRGECGSSLQLASSGGHERIVELLLQHGAEVNTDGWGTSALYRASLGGHKPIVQLLLQHGAQVVSEGDL